MRLNLGHRHARDPRRDETKDALAAFGSIIAVEKPPRRLAAGRPQFVQHPPDACLCNPASLMASASPSGVNTAAADGDRRLPSAPHNLRR